MYDGIMWEGNWSLKLFDGEGEVAPSAPEMQGEAQPEAKEQEAPKIQFPPLKNLEQYLSRNGLKPVTSSQEKEPLDAQTETQTETPAPQEPQTNEPKDKRAEWDKIKEQYPEEFGADVKRNVDRRYREYVELKEQVTTMVPIVNMLCEQYQTNDLNIIAQRLEEMTYESAADAEGLTQEQYKKMKDLEKENKRFQQIKQQEQEQAILNAQVARWYQEEAELKQIYPDFDIKSFAAENPRFIELIRKNVSVRVAYEDVFGRDKLDQLRMQRAQAQQKPPRPVENGLRNSQTVTIGKIDPAKLTKEGREEYIRRSLRGERITF